MTAVEPAREKMFTGVKVFSATKARDRDELGENVTRWLRDNQKRVGRPDSVSRRRGIWTFVSEFARTRHYDYFDLRDLRPAIAEMRYTAAVMRRTLREH